MYQLHKNRTTVSVLVLDTGKDWKIIAMMQKLGCFRTEQIRIVLCSMNKRKICIVKYINRFLNKFSDLKREFAEFGCF